MQRLLGQITYAQIPLPWGLFLSAKRAYHLCESGNECKLLSGYNIKPFLKVSIVSPDYYPGIYLEMALAWFDMRWPYCFWTLVIQDPLNISFGNVDFQVSTPRDLGTWKQFFGGRSNLKPLILQTAKPKEIRHMFHCSAFPWQMFLRRCVDICLDRGCFFSVCPHLYSQYFS